MKNLLISIVTVTYNDSTGLEKTLTSVHGQTYNNIEHIIIDGGSTDGTIEIIEKYERRIDYWVSEKDEGIYDAMNKGIDVATGDFVVFMNAGDSFYTDETIEKVFNEIDDTNKAYFGRAKLHSEQASWLYPSLSIDKNNISSWLNSDLPNHQSIFFPKQFYKNEKYNEKYKIFGDSDYKYRVKESVGFSFVDIIVCEFSLGGLSSKFDSYKDIRMMMSETWRIGRKRKGLFPVLKRILIYHIKYLLRLILSEKLFFNTIRKVKG